MPILIFKKNVSNQDLFFQCLVEAIYILDTLCSSDKSLVPKLIEIIRRMYARVTSDISKWKRVLIPLVQFFLNHGEYTVEHWLLLQLYYFASLFGLELNVFLLVLKENHQPWPRSTAPCKMHQSLDFSLLT